MTKIVWDARGERYFELGVDRGVLFPQGSTVGVPWSGLLAVNETPTGAEERPYYIEGVKYLNLRSAEEFSATIEALGAPPEFNPCDGNLVIHTGLIATQQRRIPFGFCYRTRIGNDLDGVSHAYKIHLVYNALAAPAPRNHASISSDVSPDTLRWTISTLPPALTGYKRTAHFVVDSKDADPVALSELEDLLYGTVSTDATLPTPDELVAIFTP